MIVTNRVLVVYCILAANRVTLSIIIFDLISFFDSLREVNVIKLSTVVVSRKVVISTVA